MQDECRASLLKHLLNSSLHVEDKEGIDLAELVAKQELCWHTEHAADGTVVDCQYMKIESCSR